MSLVFSVQRALELLSEDPKTIDGLWAYNACKLSQEIIEDVLECCPPPEYVEDVILNDILSKFVEHVSNIEEQKRGGSWTKYLKGFRKNINNRCSCLKNYAPLVAAKPKS